MRYLIKVKIIVLLLSIVLLTNSCFGLYCALSDSVSDFCYGVRRRENEKMEFLLRRYVYVERYS